MSDEPYSAGRREGILDGLNPSQQEAVTHGGGPLLVVAGAGSGKTRVLTRRVAWLIAGGLPARSVLAITFTNKAAGVLRERLGGLPGAYDVWAGTFHGFGSFMLRRRGEAIGIPSDFTILDREDQRRLLRNLVQDRGLDPKQLKPRDLAEMISLIKNGATGPKPLDLDIPAVEAAFQSVFDGYRDRLRASNLLDFDDLLLEPLRLLEEDEDTRTFYAERFAHVLVDEYQDTNVVQARLLRRLLGPGKNLTVVGDPDQSIYRWRGAVVRNILDFEKDFPGARTVLLEQNYRSTARILAAAEHVIARNQERHAKRLFTEKGDGEALIDVTCADAEDEAAAIANLVREWQGEGHALGDIAVFYRVNAHSRAIELALRARQIPYLIVQGLEFFQRREVKDLLAYARLVENPHDDAAFLRIANVPKRGVGDASLKKVRFAALDAQLSCVEAFRQGVRGLSARAAKGIREVVDLVFEVRAGGRAPVGPMLALLAERSGYRRWLADEVERDDFAQARIENLDELVAFAREFDETQPEADLTSFLERTALVADQDGYEEAGGRVTLMSVHAAKGLEFPCVIVAGAEDDLFPHARGAEEPGGLEEERRLFYVALTRAMERLAVTHASRRMSYRGLETKFPSPFLQDVPEDLIERRGRGGPTLTLLRDRPAEPSFDFEVPDELRIGDRVRHPYFGEGVLRDRQGRGSDARVTVDFVGHGRKRLLLSHARLERMS